MSEYWSCSKFADWIRGDPKGGPKSSIEWKEWNAAAKAAHPVRYWIAEEGLDKIQKFLYFPHSVYRDISSYLHNRYVTKTHTLQSTLKRGQWYDLDTRIIECLFNELVNFVEIEQASRYAWTEENRKKFKIKDGKRNPEAGLAALDWAAALKYDDDWMDKTDQMYGQPTGQAMAAKEMKQLYIWWTVIRPVRPEPMEASGWSEYCAKNPVFSVGECFGDDDKREEQRKILSVCNLIEASYEQEDEDMLIRLIKVRKSLWT